MDKAKLAQLVQTFASGFANQLDTTAGFMAYTGINHHPLNAAPGEQVGGSDTGGMVFNVRDDLMNDLITDRCKHALTPKPIFALILFGEMGRFLGWMGHTVAFYYDNGPPPIIRYFDPNFGEYSFTDLDEFCDWFVHMFDVARYKYFLRGFYRIRYFR